MLSSEVPRLATDSPVRVFPGVWKLLSFLRLPSQDASPSLPLLSLFLFFIFCPTSFWRQWAAFLGGWCPLLGFSCFVEFTLSVQMFFWWICGGESGLPILFLRHLRITPLTFFFLPLLVMLPSEIPKLPTDPPERVSCCLETFSSFMTPRTGLHP